MSKLNFIWGTYLWLETNGPDHIHPDDLDKIKKFVPYGSIFKSDGSEGEYIRIEYGTKTFRVKDTLFRKIAKPEFEIGEEVTILNGSSAGKIGIVRHQTWHFKKQKPLYKLEIDGKMKSRNYFDEDLDKKSEQVFES